MNTKYFIVSILFICSTFFLNINSAFPESFIQPNLIGLTQQEATEKLNLISGDVHVYLRTFKLNNDIAPNGQIYKVTPAAGSEILSEQMIDMYVSVNQFTPQTFKTYPKVVGMQKKEALNTLRAANFNSLSVIYIDKKRAPQNAVNNSVVHTRRTTEGIIILTILNDNLFLVPDVRGLSFAEAQKKLKSNPGIKYVSRVDELYSDQFLAANPLKRNDIGKVIKQTPPQGKQISRDVENKILIYIATLESEKMVEVPFMVGFTESAALSSLKSRGLVPKITYKKTTSLELADKISVKTNPKFGTLVKRGSSVEFTVYQLKPKVPLLKYYSEKEAVDMLVAKGLKVEKFYTSTSQKQNDGKVAEQTPAANTQVDPGTTVTITIFKYDQIAIPNLVGMTEEKAIDFIKKFKSDLKYSVSYSNTINLSQVGKIFKINPAYKAIVRSGDSITLYVKKHVDTVPNAVGMDENQARSMIIKSGFAPTIFYVQTGTAGKVMNQSQNAGSSPSGDKINLYVAKHQETVKRQPGFWEQEYVIPYITGLNIMNARASLAANKINFTIRETTTGRDKHGKVLGVQPPAGTTVYSYSRQKVVLYVGKDYKVVPNVLGMTISEATYTIRKNGMGIKITKKPKSKTVRSSVYPIVISQDPKPGSSKQNQLIHITLAYDLEVPDLNGMPFHEAVKSIQNIGLKYAIKYVPVEDGKQDRVILKMTPYPNTPISIGEVVSFEVGKLPDNVPDVMGKTETEAVNLLKKYNFYVQTEFKDSDKNKTVVIAQSQSPGSRRGQSLIIILLGTHDSLSSISKPTPVVKPAPVAQITPPKPMASMTIKLAAPSITLAAPSITLAAPPITIDETNKIKDFYNQFKEAYESKDEYAVSDLISADWGANDGNSISDLEENLYNMFSVFDEIQYQLSGLTIEPAGNNFYKTSYTIKIKGTIFDSDITHNETSSVQELVSIENEKVKIIKTLNGSFWSMD